MTPQTQTSDVQCDAGFGGAAEIEYLSFFVDGQMFGLPLLSVQDVLDARTLTRIPLAPPEVAGALNLRGRIITAINTRRRLGMGDADPEGRRMSIVVEHEGELYNLIVDGVGDVLRLTSDMCEDNPATLDPMWRDLSGGIYRLETNLLVVLDVSKLLTFDA
ncbi:MAG: chemotaxis protein CheW [Rhodospirillales bacterium]|nr:MAG: chemotaxis protein CheW [Rhodospirillales bacterium]